MPDHAVRWSDDRLEDFYREFSAHIKQEEAQSTQQSEIHRALFQRADPEANTPPGVIQLLSQLDTRTRTMEIANDRQKRFVGGVLFAFSCMGFFFTDTAHKVLAFFRSL